MKSIRHFSVSHERPLVPKTLYDFVIGLGDHRPECGAPIEQIDHYWAAQRPLAYGAAGGYVIPKILATLDPGTELTGISSHRKIVVRRPIGRESSTYPGMREITAGELEVLGREEIGPLNGSDFLISAPLNFPHGLMRQYADHHPAIDLVDYLSLATKMSILTGPDVNDFVRTSIFFPGGCELGVFPTGWLSETLAKLEAISREFLAVFGGRIRHYDPYQVRAVGFLSERLGSYFLLREFVKRFPGALPREAIGYMCCVVPQGQVYRHSEASG